MRKIDKAVKLRASKPKDEGESEIRREILSIVKVALIFFILMTVLMLALFA